MNKKLIYGGLLFEFLHSVAAIMYLAPDSNIGVAVIPYFNWNFMFQVSLGSVYVLSHIIAVCAIFVGIFTKEKRKGIKNQIKN